MISHLSLGVRDLGRSGQFYDPIFMALGCARSAGAKSGELAYGPDGQGIFWLYEVDGQGPLGTAGSHIAFRAPGQSALHAAADAARDGGADFTRDPGPHPDIGADYYGAIFLDPDGHKIELVVE